ncbi:peptide MFS transporter [Legionella adelaidensis]|uniref:peptide MFS transporter n=1 Tax=Legionella adelaidensis TaxID=45056 RepID=UPI0022B29BCF|nr:peptide MFS transporter [Legionella adelaidensis]
MSIGEINHPPSLRIFFATEMWERYGFYVVQTLLALYLLNHFKWADSRIYPVVGSFTAITYISPVIGGWIADHLLGQKRTILIGAIVLFFSYLLLGFIHTDQALMLMLGGIAVGTGLLKPNISSLLGNEYPQTSANRESGFTIFYMGITSGIILGTLLPSYIQQLFGWSVTFLSAAFGMVIASIVFVFGIYRYRIADYHPYAHQKEKVLYAVALISLLWLISFYILRDPLLANGVFAIVVILSIGFIISNIKQDDHEQAIQTIIIGLLCLISAMFWSFYFQMFLSLTLFLKRVVQPSLFGIPFPPPYYVAVQSVGMIIFGYFLARSRKNLSLPQRAISIGNKFLIAMIFISAAYLLITIASNTSSDNSLLSPLYFIPAYLFISIAELLLSPVGLAAVTMLASHKKVSTMMGIFFVSLGIGGFLSGKLANLTSIPQNQLETISVEALKSLYGNSFKILFLILVGLSFVSLVLNLIIKRLIYKTFNKVSV